MSFTNDIKTDERLFDEEYVRLEKKAIIFVQEFFKEHGPFVGNLSFAHRKLETKLPKKDYRFRNIVHKYFVNVSLDLKKIPSFRYFLTVPQFIFYKKYDPRYKRLVAAYLPKFKHELNRFKEANPWFDLNEEALSQLIKVVYACLLAQFIRQPVFRRSMHWKALDASFYYGLQLGLMYLVSDSFLDNACESKENKRQFNVFGLQLLSGQSVENSTPHPSFQAIYFLFQRMEKRMPFLENEDRYRHLYFLQKVQYEEGRYKAYPNDLHSIQYKIALIGLKTFLSFVVMLPTEARNIEMLFEKAFLFSLYTQLDDDMRDVLEDQQNQIQTLFSSPLESELFNEHLFMLRIMETMLEKNPSMRWIYQDYWNHIHRKHGQDSMDKEKIRIFIKKVVERDINEIGSFVSESWPQT
jgi:hypothetical protein